MKRQAFAAPGLLFEREQAGDEIVVFEARPAQLLDPADDELERPAGGDATAGNSFARSTSHSPMALRAKR